MVSFKATGAAQSSIAPGLRATALLALGLSALGVTVAFAVTREGEIGIVLVPVIATWAGIWFNQRAAWIGGMILGIVMFGWVWLAMSLVPAGWDSDYPPKPLSEVASYAAAFIGSATLIVLPFVALAYESTGIRRLAAIVICLLLMAFLAQCSAPVVSHWLT